MANLHKFPGQQNSVFFPQVCQKTYYGSIIAKNLKIDQCMKKQISIMHLRTFTVLSPSQ